MRKFTAARLLLALALGATSVLGMFHATSQPAQALNCPFQIGGCSRAGTQHYGNMICCLYACPSGDTLEGPCEICP